MYIDSCTSKDGKYTRHLLRENYREGTKVKHRTVANLSRCSPRELEAIKLALKHKDDLENLTPVGAAVSLHQGLSVGAVAVVHAVARELGIADALGHTRAGKLALWQVIARVIDQGSRLSAVRLATSHAAGEIVGSGAFNEDDLYANLDWLAEKQSAIEDRLFRRLHGEHKPGLYLYDVTSSYLEGRHNEQAALDEVAKLDGCYVLKTDLPQHAAYKQTIHSRYKDLALVEQAFRTSKTVLLEMRPVNVRLESRTRGHAFVVMLAYRIARELARRWASLDLTVQEAIDQLSTLCATELRIDGTPRCNKVPEPRGSVGQLIDAAGVTLPAALPMRTATVATRKKLVDRRKSR